MIEIILNGEKIDVKADLRLDELVNVLGRDPRGIAIERNGEIVPKSRHGVTRLSAGDRLEIVQFVGGG